MMRTIKYLVTEGLPITFIVFYSVGLALYFTPFTHEMFKHITPYSLVLVAAAIFSQHKKWDVKTVVVLLGIFVMGIAAEIIGVATGKLFGVYNYGSGLGVKIANVPVVIGLNWVFLVYTSNCIMTRYTSKNYLIIIGASLLMIMYDIVLEKAAPLMDMWEFSSNEPPIDNYIVWFILALIFNWAIQYSKVNTDNRSARWLFFSQFGFFIAIVLHNMFF